MIRRALELKKMLEGQLVRRRKMKSKERRRRKHV
jgi:hypothetical protein